MEIGDAIRVIITVAILVANSSATGSLPSTSIVCSCVPSAQEKKNEQSRLKRQRALGFIVVLFNKIKNLSGRIRVFV